MTRPIDGSKKPVTPVKKPLSKAALARMAKRPTLAQIKKTEAARKKVMF